MLKLVALFTCVSTIPAQVFEVASVKPNRSGRMQGSTGRSGDQITFENVPLREWIEIAYGVPDRHYLLSGPAWLDSERFDLVAKVPPDVPRAQVLVMLRALLTERFLLQTHVETRELNVYSLTIARAGPKLQLSPTTEANFTFGSGHIVAKALSMEEFAARLSGPVFKLGRPVLNTTGLSDAFDFTLDWRSDEIPVETSAAPSLFTAIQEQLGLRLEPAKSKLEIRVVDHAERVPAGN
jgi:uncharacterized protein (TIGR03435 family)